MRVTLEQLRAKDAWNRATECDDSYLRAAKGLPAMIMSSGLMQALAFAEHKGGGHEKVARHLRCWLARRMNGWKEASEPDFKEFMDCLMAASSQEYQAIHAEAFAWLKWLRHMAAARTGDK